MAESRSQLKTFTELLYQIMLFGIRESKGVKLKVPQ